MNRLRTIDDVVASQLCVGCGVCAYLARDRFRMVDVPDHGIRPARAGAGAAPADEEELVGACPGASLRHDFDRADPRLDADLLPGWGPVLEVWEGYAADPEIRFAGSSGGAATALALHAIERRGMHGVLHTRGRPENPIFNETVLSRTHAELLAATGSRYAPASPCDGLALVEAAPGPCVFIGKPCDVAAVRSARAVRPALDAKVGLTIAFFCAGTPSTRGTLELLKSVGVEDPASVTGLRYRGNGWPGRWTVTFRTAGGAEETRSVSYEDSWGFVQRYRQWRCYVCPDHTGEFADVAVGDPWYKAPEGSEERGRSLILARTPLGRDAIFAAQRDGYLVLMHSDPTLLPRSQPNLLYGRGALWGRLLGLRLAAAPRPEFTGFPAFRFWWRRLTLREKASSVLGTIRRVRTKGLKRRLPPPEVSAEERPAGPAP